MLYGGPPHRPQVLRAKTNASHWISRRLHPLHSCDALHIGFTTGNSNQSIPVCVFLLAVLESIRSQHYDIPSRRRALPSTYPLDSPRSLSGMWKIGRLGSGGGLQLCWKRNQVLDCLVVWSDGIHFDSAFHS